MECKIKLTHKLSYQPQWFWLIVMWVLPALVIGAAIYAYNAGTTLNLGWFIALTVIYFLSGWATRDAAEIYFTEKMMLLLDKEQKDWVAFTSKIGWIATSTISATSALAAVIAAITNSPSESIVYGSIVVLATLAYALHVLNLLWIFEGYRIVAKLALMQINAYIASAQQTKLHIAPAEDRFEERRSNLWLIFEPDGRGYKNPKWAIVRVYVNNPLKFLPIIGSDGDYPLEKEIEYASVKPVLYYLPDKFASMYLGLTMIRRSQQIKLEPAD